MCVTMQVKHLENCKTQPSCTSCALFAAFLTLQNTLQTVFTGGQHPSGAGAQPGAPNQPETNQATSGRDKLCHAVLTHT